MLFPGDERLWTNLDNDDSRLREARIFHVFNASIKDRQWFIKKRKSHVNQTI